MSDQRLQVFDLVEQEPGTLKVVVFEDGQGRFEAWVDGGWWCAKSDTPQGAVEAAIDRCRMKLGNVVGVKRCQP